MYVSDIDDEGAVFCDSYDDDEKSHHQLELSEKRYFTITNCVNYNVFITYNIINLIVSIGIY